MPRMRVLRFLRQKLLKHVRSCAGEKVELPFPGAFPLWFSLFLIQPEPRVTLQPVVATGTTTKPQIHQ